MAVEILPITIVPQVVVGRAKPARQAMPGHTVAMVYRLTGRKRQATARTVTSVAVAEVVFGLWRTLSVFRVIGRATEVKAVVAMEL